MKFGSVPYPELIDFTLPKDHKDTKRVLNLDINYKQPQVYVGCAKWNRADLRGFYPRGTKDELKYYGSQFNAIEMNATFYSVFPPEQFTKWHNKTPVEFKFFPKIHQDISHSKRLKGIDTDLEQYLNSVTNLKDKLGTIFLQFHNDFSPKSFDNVVGFVEKWPKNRPLALEFRHTDWFNNTAIANELYQLLEDYNIANTIVDTAGRRDIMHMRLTNATAFVRYVGTNHNSDYSRLDDWVKRLKIWQEQGVKEINFFMHQNVEVESPLLANYFIKKLNSVLGCNLKVPNENNNGQQKLF